jgi:hypothetical protein
MERTFLIFISDPFDFNQDLALLSLSIIQVLPGWTSRMRNQATGPNLQESYCRELDQKKPKTPKSSHDISFSIPAAHIELLFGAFSSEKDNYGRGP